MEIKHNLTIKEQIASLLLEQINTGKYTPGQRLPSESELSQELKVSRASVRSALSALETAGLISRKQGDGTYVTANRPGLTSMASSVWEFTHLIHSQGRKCSLVGLGAARRKPTEFEQAALALEGEGEVASVERLIYADGLPIIYSINVFPLSILKAGITLDQLDLSKGLDDFVASYFELKISGVDMEIRAQSGLEGQIDGKLAPGRDNDVKLVEVFSGEDNRPVIYAHNYIRNFSLPMHVYKPW